MGHYSMVVGAKIDSCTRCPLDSYTLSEGSSECISTSVENPVIRLSTTSGITIPIQVFTTPIPASTTHIPASTTPIPESTTKQNILSSTHAALNKTTTIPQTTPTILTLENMDTYEIIISFKLNFNSTQITDVMKNNIRVETSKMLNINITRIGLLSFELPILSRRLLSELKVSFSIFPDSLEETKRVQNTMSLDMLNIILLTSSGNVLMATDLEIDIKGTDQDNTPKSQINNFNIIIIIVCTLFILCLVGIILVCFCMTKKNPKVFSGELDPTKYCIVCSYEKSLYSDFGDSIN